jgi:hypothetical protein
MESRFNEDFGGVRVHTDAQAARSARSVNASAYTAGQHIVFDRGRYAPHTSAGQRLLAHELTHVLQQSGGHAFADSLQRAADADAQPDGSGGGAPQTEDTAGAPDGGAVGQQGQTPAPAACPCNPAIGKGEDCPAKGHGKEVMDAFSKAATFLANTQPKIDDFISAPTDPANAAVATALQKHFNVASGSSDAVPTATQIKGVISRSLTNITQPICSHCPDSCGSGKDETTIAAISPNAWAKTNCYTFCPSFFKFSATEQGKIAVHEMMHSWERMGDAAYESQGSPTYPPVTAVAKVTADCYASLIRDLG